MANVRKSTDGRKRTRTMEYIDNQVDISEDISQKIDAHFDLPDEIKGLPSTRTLSKRNSEQSYLSRQISDMSLSKPVTGFKGRDHVLQLMKTSTTSKPMMEFQNPKLIQEMLAKRQEVTRTISDFALQYGLIDNDGKKAKSRKTSDIITDMTNQLESLKPKRQVANSSLLRVLKIEAICNRLVCTCQYVDERQDVVLFIDPNNEQAKTLAINDQLRVPQEARYDLNIPEIGLVTMGITEVRKESPFTPSEEGLQTDPVHTYDFDCSCNECNSKSDDIEQVFSSPFDLRATFPRTHQHFQANTRSNDIVYDSFTLALMTKRIFDLRASIIIYNPDKRTSRYIFIVRDGIGNCLEILLNEMSGLPIEIQTKSYIFRQIEFVERIESPKESQRWPYENYLPPKKLFSFKSRENGVSVL